LNLPSPDTVADDEAYVAVLERAAYQQTRAAGGRPGSKGDLCRAGAALYLGLFDVAPPKSTRTQGRLVAFTAMNVLFLNNHFGTAFVALPPSEIHAATYADAITQIALWIDAYVSPPGPALLDRVLLLRKLFRL
jgi:hypothetical protein